MYRTSSFHTEDAAEVRLDPPTYDLTEGGGSTAATRGDDDDAASAAALRLFAFCKQEIGHLQEVFARSSLFILRYLSPVRAIRQIRRGISMPIS